MNKINHLCLKKIFNIFRDQFHMVRRYLVNFTSTSLLKLFWSLLDEDITFYLICKFLVHSHCWWKKHGLFCIKLYQWWFSVKLSHLHQVWNSAIQIKRSLIHFFCNLNLTVNLEYQTEAMMGYIANILECWSMCDWINK